MKRKAWVVVLFVLALTALSVGRAAAPTASPAGVPLACLDAACGIW